MLAQLFLQPRSVAKTVLDPGADKHQIFAVDSGTQQSLLHCGVVEAARLSNDLVRRVHRLFRQLQRQGARAWWLSVDFLGKCRGAGTEERDAFPLAQVLGDPFERELADRFHRAALPRRRDSASITSWRSWSGRLVTPKAPAGTPPSALGRPT